MAATADLNTTRRAPGTLRLALAAATVIYGGTLVCRNADGRAVPASDDDTLTFVGIAESGADNAGGAAGAKSLDVVTEGTFRLHGDFAAADVGKLVYIIDDSEVGMVDDADVDEYVPVGVVEEYISATEAWVRINSIDAAELGRLRRREFTVRVVGPNATAFNLAGVAAQHGGAGFYVSDVLSATAFVTSTGAPATPAMKVGTTHYTLSGGTLTAVGNETANTWVIHFIGVLL